MTKGRVPKIYRVYLARNNSFLTAGTARSCAGALGMRVESFYNIISRSKHGSVERYKIVEVKAS